MNYLQFWVRLTVALFVLLILLYILVPRTRASAPFELIRTRGAADLLESQSGFKNPYLLHVPYKGDTLIDWPPEVKIGDLGALKTWCYQKMHYQNETPPPGWCCSSGLIC